MDKGPWGLLKDDGGNLEGVCSSDFKHDVILYVSGDFYSPADKEDYCTWLCEKLNRKEDN